MELRIAWSSVMQISDGLLLKVMYTRQYQLTGIFVSLSRLLPNLLELEGFLVDDREILLCKHFNNAMNII